MLASLGSQRERHRSIAAWRVKNLNKIKSKVTDGGLSPYADGRKTSARWLTEQIKLSQVGILR